MSDSSFVFNVSATEFETRVLDASHSTPVLVDFWAAWCNPCQMLMPVLANLAEEFNGKFLVAKVNTEEEQELTLRFGVRSLPTVKLFKNGQAVDEFLGALPEFEIRTFLDKHIPRASDKLLAEAQSLMQAGKLEQALALTEQAKDFDPDNPRGLIAYARLQATLGDVDAAESTLAELPINEQQSPEVSSLRARFVFDKTALDAPTADALEKALENNPADSEARYQLAAHRVMTNDYEAALEQLLLLLRQDRKYGNDAARKGMLAIFDILGGSGDLVNKYRTRMFNALH